MSQYLINAIDLPSGTLPTTPVVIKDNDLAGLSNSSNYKYYQYGIPELTYIKFNGDNTIVKSTDIIQAVENGYYPIIVVSSSSSSASAQKSTDNLLKYAPNGEYPSVGLSPGVWGFSYYFYKNNELYAMFTCLQSFQTSNSSSIRGLRVQQIGITDYLGNFINAFCVDSDGYWYTTADLFAVTK